MPDQPSWIERLPEIVKQLKAPGAPPFLDRPAVETLFHLRRRRSIDLLRACGGYKVGKTYLAPRESVLQFLDQPRRRSAAAHENGRLEQVQLALGAARDDFGGRRIAIPANEDTLRLGFSALPDGIRFAPGELRVAFEQPAELLEKLFALAQALSNDYEGFERSFEAARQAAGAA